MANPPSVAAFYDDDRLGNLFRASGPYYDDFGHKGVDLVHAARTPVPSWCSGRVVVSTFYRALGVTVIVDRGAGAGLDRFAGYCHLTTESAVPVGRYVNVGDIVGTVGSTGTASSGPHLHATLEPAVTIGTRNARDPLPLIRKAVASLSLAGGGSTPVQPAPKRKRKSMTTLYYTKDNEGNLFALAGDGGGSAAWLETRDQGLANDLAAQHGNAAYLSPASFASWKARYLEGGKVADVTVNAVDLKPVLDAIKAVPTATQNGAAARAAIVKP